MGNWSLGSASDAVYNSIPNIPASISGTQLLGIIDRVRLKIEDYTGLNVGSVGIAERFQPALYNLSMGEVLPLIHLQGGDTSIGDIRVGRAALDGAAHFKEEGWNELKRLGMKSTISKVFG